MRLLTWNTIQFLLGSALLGTYLVLTQKKAGLDKVETRCWGHTLSEHKNYFMRLRYKTITLTSNPSIGVFHGRGVLRFLT